MRRQRRAAKTHALLAIEQLEQVSRGRTVATCLEHPLQQLLGRFARLDVEQLLAVLGKHQTRLQFEQRRDQDDELGRGLQVQLAATLQIVEVGKHHVGELQVEQIDLLAQHKREQQVEGTAKYLQIELERRERHAPTVPVAPDGASRWSPKRTLRDPKAGGVGVLFLFELQ